LLSWGHEGNEDGNVTHNDYSRMKTWCKVSWWLSVQQRAFNVSNEASTPRPTWSIQSSLDTITYQLKIDCERYEFSFKVTIFCTFSWMQMHKPIRIHRKKDCELNNWDQSYMTFVGRQKAMDGTADMTQRHLSTSSNMNQ